MSSRRIQPQHMLYGLVVAHVVASSLAIALHSFITRTADGTSEILVLGLLLAQLALVAFWGTMGLASTVTRVVGSIVAILYWMFLFHTPARNLDPDLILFILGYTAIFGLPLWALRQWVAELKSSAPHTRAGTQFQLRHLFLLTFAISLLLAVGKWVPPESMYGVGRAITMVVLAFAAGSIGVAAVWAMLSKTSIWIPALLLLGYAASAGWFLDTRFSPSSNSLFLTSMFTIETALLLASLALVRHCGYRLVSLRPLESKL